MRDLEALCDVLESRTDDYVELCDRAAVAEHAYRMKKAHAFITYANDRSTKRTQAMIGALVDQHCGDEMREHKTLEAARNSCRESLSTLRTQIEARRTLSANHRAQGA